MKRFLCLTLALVFAIGICFSAPVTITASATDGVANFEPDYEDNGKYKFALNQEESGYILYGLADGYTLDNGEITLPNEFREKEVVEIADKAFQAVQEITSVTIPDSYKKIGSYVFNDCPQFHTLNIVGGVKEIGMYSFSDCSSLSTVTFPDTIEKVGEGVLSETAFIESTENYERDMIYSGDVLLDNYNSEEYLAVARYGTKVIADAAILGEFRYYIVPETVEYIGDHALGFYKKDANGEFVLSEFSDVTIVGVKDSVAEEYAEKHQFPFMSFSEFFEDVYNLNYQYKASVDGTGYALRENYGDDGLDYILLPSSYKGKEIVEISNNALNKKIRKISIPDSVKLIDDKAFGDWGTKFLLASNDYDEKGLLYIGKHLIAQNDFSGALEIENGISSIMGGVFADNTAITSVVLPESITHIADRTFAGCTSLSSVALTNEILTIGDSAFEGCTFESVDLGEELISIGASAFKNCKNLTSIIIPASVTKIDKTAFIGCDNLTSITVSPNNDYYTVENGILYNKDKTEIIFCCYKNLTEFEITDTIEEMDMSILLNNENLTSIKVNENNKNYSSDENGILYNKDKTKLIYCPMAKTGDLTLPDSVKVIASEAFKNSSLTNVSLPNGLETIEKSAFEKSKITSIEIPAGITVLEEGVFNNCTDLTFVIISDNLTEIKANCFEKCEKLKSVSLSSNYATVPASNSEQTEEITTDIVFSSSLKTIGDYAFNQCKSIQELIIPATVVSIGGGAFCESGLTYLDVNAKKIGGGAFASCSALNNIILGDSVEVIYAAAFGSTPYINNIEFDEDGFKYLNGFIIEINNAEEISGEFTFKAGTKGFLSGMFSDNSKITKVTIPGTIKTIPNNAFSWCTALEEVVIEDGVKNIETGAFYSCEKLEKITIPNSVDTIEGAAFHTIGIEGNGLKFIEFADDNPHFVYDNGVIYSKDKTVLVGFADGVFRYDSDFNLTVPTLKLPNTVTKIQDNALEGIVLNKLVLPESLTEISKDIFGFTANIGTIQIPSSITKLPDYCFCLENSYIGNVILPETIEYIGDYALAGTRIQEVDLPNVEYIGEGAFSNNIHLETVSINGTITELPEKTFMNSGVYNVYLPNGITKMGDSCFENCENLIEFVIPDNVIEISSRCFADCASLQNLKIADSVKRIAPSAFFGCESLKKALVPSNVIEIGEMALGYVANEKNSEAQTFSLRRAVASLRNVPSMYSRETVYEANNSEVSAKKTEDFTIYGFENTEAQKYAIRNDMSFEDGTGFHICIASDWVVTTEATCKTKGRKEKRCVDCNELIDESSVQITHKFENDICSICKVEKDDLHESEHPYSPNIDESWVIHKTGAKRIALTFSDDTNLNFDDEISIYCGEVGDSNSEITYESLNHFNTYNDIALADKRIIVEGDTVLIRMETQDSYGEEFYGFSLVNVEYFSDVCTHSSTKIVNYSSASCEKWGYTGDTVCANENCLKFLKEGQMIEKKSHEFENNICKNCSKPKWDIKSSDGVNVTINGYLGDEKELIIPATINDFTVVEISQYAFSYKENLQSVSIPKNVTSINREAFSGCSNLNNVKLVKGITHIADCAFFDCIKLVSINIPDSVTSIGRFAFGYFSDDGETNEKIPGFTIYGKKGSVAEEYANENGFTFKESETNHECTPGDEWITEDGKHWHVCTCGEKLDEATCSGGTATCTKKAVCSTCKHEYDDIDPTNHAEKSTEWTTENGEHWHVCSCGKLDKATCSGGTATCKKQAVCETCKKAYGNVNSKNHVNLKTLPAVPASCKATGLTEGKRCLDCGTTTVPQNVVPKTTNHSYTYKVTTPAKCGKNAVETGTCSICSGTVTREVQNTALTHTYTKYEQVKAPTCTAEGLERAKCDKGCGATHDRAIKALNHNIVKDPAVAPTCTVAGKTEGSHCTRCNGATVPQNVVVAKGHQLTLVGKKPATFETEGHTGAEVCSVCKQTINAGSVIKKLTFTTPVVTAVATKDGIQVSWNKVENAQSYVLYKRVYDATAKKWSKWAIINSNLTSLSFTDNTVTLGTKYRYTVRAKNGNTLSPYESTSTVKYNVTPTVKAANATGGIKVSWSTAANATGYRVYRSTLSNGKWSGWKNMGTAAANKTSWTDKSVKTGVTYKYTVRAVYNKILSSYNKDGAVRLFLSTPIVKIANIANGIQVKWNSVSGATGYVVYSSQFDPATNKWSGWVNRGTVNTTNWTDTTVKSGVTYKYTVRALNGNTLSAYKGSSGLIYLLEPTVKISNAAKGIKVTWSQCDGATGYTVYRREYNPETKKWSKWKSRGTAAATKSSWTDKKVTSGKYYKYTVRAVNGNFKSSYVSTGSLLYLAQPTVTVKAVDNGINVAWTQCAGATGYRVYRAELVNGNWSNWKSMGTAKANKNNWTDKSAEKGKTYKYTVRSVNNKAKSSFADGTAVSR